MDLILDTCALLSLSGLGRRKLTKKTLQLICNAGLVSVSACSLFEISLKRKRKQLSLGRFATAQDFWDEAVQSYDLQELPVQAQDFHAAVKLPDHHADPFDRIIIAQALRTGSEIVTYDKLFEQYEVPLHV
jgi:PIN domain nuclease of toxin-antitoxin system